MNKYDVNKWDKYKIQPSQESPVVPSVNKWDKYKIMPSQEEAGDSWPALIGKSALKGMGYIADLPNLAAQGLEGLARGQAESERRKFELMGYPGSDIETPEIDILSRNIPTSDDARGYVERKTGIDLEPRPTTGAQRIAMHATETASPAGLVGFLGKGASLANKGLKAAASARTGAGIGATSGVLQEGGVNPLAADLASSFVSPVQIAKKAASSAQKIPFNIMGLNSKGMNIPAGQAARDLGIDLPAAALTDSTLTGLADQWIGKTPFFGNVLKKKYATTEDQVRTSLDSILKKVGPAKSPETTAKIDKLYDLSRDSLPAGATINPTNLDKAIDSIKFKSLIPTADEASVQKTLKTIKKTLNPGTSLYSPFGKIKIPLQDLGIDVLIDTKKSLNAAVKWDTEQGVKNVLKKLQKGAAEDIAEYGKANPEWYKTFKDADRLYGKTAKRAQLEKILEPTVNAATDTLSYNALSKAINARKNQKTFRKLEPETFKKIQKIGKVAQAMAIKSQNIPNPSGTAVTAATMGLVGSIFYNPIGLLTGSGVSSVIGAGAGSKLLTDKKFIDLALKLAENPNKPNLMTTMALNKRIKKVTGYSALALSKKLNREDEE